MANADNSPFVKHPALLALFAPRPPVPFKAPMPMKSMPKLTGIAQFTQFFGKEADRTPPEKHETPKERKKRLAAEKAAKHKKVLLEREKHWDPHHNDNATRDPYKTLFVARLSYELTEDDLREEFQRFGRIRDVKLILDTATGKSRGYAFIEFERSNDLKDAFQHADGHKLKDRRILVDVERGRTVKTWRPRKLGGGLGKTRASKPADGEKSAYGLSGTSSPRSSPNKYSYRDSGRRRERERDSKYRERRDKYRDRDYRDRDRKTRSDRERRRSRSKSRDRKDRSRRRDREKRDSRRSGRDRDRKDRSDGKERDRSRRSRRSSKERSSRRR